MTINYPSIFGARQALQNPLFAAVALGMLVGCSNGQEANTASTETADTAATEATGEVLRIGTEGAYAPFNYTNADGSLGGFDIEIANALCDDCLLYTSPSPRDS